MTDTIKKEAVPTAGKPRYSFPFSVGADPEFTVISGTRPMHAEDIFKTFFGEMKKGDHGFIVPGGNLGWDNHPATGELRPNPGSPEEVVANLRLIFAEAHKRMPFVDLTTLTVAAATGGHIHLSIPEELNNEASRKGAKWAAIERALGTFILLIMIGENNLSREMRRRFQGGNYGDLMDFRVDSKFQHPTGAPGLTLEVRGPTAEWVTSEKLALGTLAYIAIAWDNITKGNLKPIAEALFRNKTQAEESVAPMMNNFMNAQRTYLNKIRPFIRSHPAYHQYKNALELVMNPSRVIEEKKRMHYCINEGWGFTLASKHIPTNKFLNEEAIEEATSKLPEQIIRNLSQFAWNEDLHVEQFATGLSKRCIALGWKPTHEYFFFGLKKGFDSIIMRDEKGDFISGTEIAKTKEDLKVIKNKFDRLSSKAEPVYERVINPRTGDLANPRDNKRIMVGLPYEIRRRGNIRPLIRLVLQFEKNPKAFSALDASSLPEGASHLKEALLEEEKIERGVSSAIQRGEKAQQLPQDMANAALEELNERDPFTIRAGMSEDSWQAVRIRLNELDNLFSRNYLPNEAAATDCIRSLIGRRTAEWPAIPNETVLGQVLMQLRDILMILRSRAPGTDVPNEIMVGRMQATCYLLCAAIGEQGGASLEQRRNGFSHEAFRITSPTEENSYALRTSGRTSRNGTTGAAILTDLFGISNPEWRANVIRMLDEHADTRFVFRLNADGVREQVVIGVNQTIYINPDDALPHVWNA